MNSATVKNSDTKNKILLVANELFARNGFDGVSIRDIAQEADVNVASINYHFKNKLNLLHEIFNYNYDFIEEGITKITQDADFSTEDLACEIFDLFMRNGPALINGFKIILSDHLTPPADEKRQRTLGPPGGMAILKVVTKEFGEDLPLRAREWVVRMLMSNIFHNAAIMNSTYCENFHKGDYWMDDEFKKFEIKQLSKALTSQMLTQSDKWK